MYALLLFAALQTSNGQPQPPSACELLYTTAIERVQASPVTAAKPSENERKGLRFAQCVYATADFAHSVSVTLITARTRGAVTSYWAGMFHEIEKHRTTSVIRKKEDEPAARRVRGIGTEAFWTGEARAGALYVRSGDRVLRVSVGGVRDEPERIRRSRMFAVAALRRLEG
jgi:hypothetical protein